MEGNSTAQWVADPTNPLSLLSMLLVGSLLFALITISIAGNVLVCAAIFTDRGLRKDGNLFLASLAIADLFVAALVMTFAGVNDLMGYWVFGEKFCDTWVAFDVMCSTASILNLCAISLDRYIHIKDPLRYGRWVTKRIVCAIIAGVWLLAALISFVPISLGLHRPPQPKQAPKLHPEELPTCALDLTPTYAVVSSCIGFVVPCIVMVGIYFRLYLYAQQHAKSIRALQLSARPGTSNLASKKCKLSKAAVTIGVIMGVFLVCWVPFFCVNIAAAYCKTCIPGMAFKALTWLGYCNSAFNPIIYSIFNTEFREAFRRILTAHARPLCCCSGCCSQYQVVSGIGGDVCGHPGVQTACSSRGPGATAGANGACEPMQRSSGSATTPRQTRLNSTELSAHSEDIEKNVDV